MSHPPANPACIVGLASAVPDAVLSQEQALEFAQRIMPLLTSDQRRQMEAIYRRSNVHARRISGASSDAISNLSALYEPSSLASPLGPTTQRRMVAYQASAEPLATRAARDALTDAHTTSDQITSASITHLITATCTGFASPGWELDLLRTVNLRPTVHRTHLGFMGCHAAINALRLAASIATSDPKAVVLVVSCEVCSVHFQYSLRPEHMVANALFADGAAACVVKQSAAGLAIESSAALIAPDSASDMGWHITDHGFAMTLSPNIPPIIEQSAAAFIADLQSAAAGEPIVHYAIHPGGPKILTAFQTGLRLPDTALAPSRSVLQQMGNMSSPTVMCVLEQILAEHRLQNPSQGRWALQPAALVSFGPGVAAEACLLAGRTH